MVASSDLTGVGRLNSAAGDFGDQRAVGCRRRRAPAGIAVPPSDARESGARPTPSLRLMARYRPSTRLIDLAALAPTPASCPSFHARRSDMSRGGTFGPRRPRGLVVPCGDARGLGIREAEGRRGEVGARDGGRRRGCADPRPRREYVGSAQGARRTRVVARPALDAGVAIHLVETPETRPGCWPWRPSGRRAERPSGGRASDAW